MESKIAVDESSAFPLGSFCSSHNRSMRSRLRHDAILCTRAINANSLRRAQHDTRVRLPASRETNASEYRETWSDASRRAVLAEHGPQRVRNLAQRHARLHRSRMRGTRFAGPGRGLGQGVRRASAAASSRPARKRASRSAWLRAPAPGSRRWRPAARGLVALGELVHAHDDLARFSSTARWYS